MECYRFCNQFTVCGNGSIACSVLFSGTHSATLFIWFEFFLFWISIMRTQWMNSAFDDGLFNYYFFDPLAKTFLSSHSQLHRLIFSSTSLSMSMNDIGWFESQHSVSIFSFGWKWFKKLFDTNLANKSHRKEIRTCAPFKFFNNVQCSIYAIYFKSWNALHSLAIQYSVVIFIWRNSWIQIS